MTEHALLWFVGLPLAAYVIGSTPFGAIIARFHGVNIRDHGSGNVGATNVGRVIGAKWGLLCFGLDVLKGFGPTLGAGWLLTGLSGDVPQLNQQLCWVLVALGTVLGHVFSFWLKFRGGKGVATGLGAVLGVWPFLTAAGVAALVAWILTTFISRYVSLASVLAALLFPLLFVGWNYLRGDWQTVQYLWPLGLFAVMITLVIVVRHRSNISRLLAGTENKINDKAD